jgi:hypothetical protein
MPENQDSKSIPAVDPSRRIFITKFAGLAFAAPIIASFALDGMASATSRTGPGSQHRCSNQHIPNQHVPNQHIPNQCCPNQHIPNQHIPNQHIPNQHIPNQHIPNQCCPNQFLPNQDLPNACDRVWRWREHGFGGQP